MSDTSPQQQPGPAQSELAPAGGSVRDWPEDAELENGNYINRCDICGDTFIGHKRRTRCKECAAECANILRKETPNGKLSV